MKAIEIDEMLHKIREERAKEVEGLTTEERVRRANEIMKTYAKKHGLNVIECPQAA